MNKDNFILLIVCFFSYKTTKKKKKVHLPEQNLVSEVDVLKFYEGASTSKDFAEVVIEELSRRIGTGFDEVNVQKLCWEHYYKVCSFLAANVDIECVV